MLNLLASLLIFPVMISLGATMVFVDKALYMEAMISLVGCLCGALVIWQLMRSFPTPEQSKEHV